MGLEGSGGERRGGWHNLPEKETVKILRERERSTQMFTYFLRREEKRPLAMQIEDCGGGAARPSWPPIHGRPVRTPAEFPP